MHVSYKTFWRNNITSKNINRLEFYGKIKSELRFEEYLNIPNFEIRKTIAKLRCSDHQLEIEKGRHKKIPREDRLCKLCSNKVVETEEHFLLQCSFYDALKAGYNITYTIDTLFENTNLVKLGEYLILAFDKRKSHLQI